MASTYLTRTESSGNRKIGTVSVWVKRGSLGNQYIYNNWNTSTSGYQSSMIQFTSSDRLEIVNYQASGGSHSNIATNRLFRDVNAWYHIVINWDTTQSTSSNRYKMYVNGVQETSFSTSTYPSLNEDLYFNIGGSSNPLTIGSLHSTGGGSYFDGSMSHYHNIDGTAYDASAFGETDSTTGEWKIKTSPSVSYGTNGFFILKDGNSVTDQSGNGNNFTVGAGDLTKTEDCPSNVYATANPLVRNQVTITTANLTVRSPSSNWMGIPATLGVSSGKYYWEYKLALGNAWSQCGVMSSRPTGGYNGIYSTYVGNLEGGLALNSGNGDFYHNGSSGAYSTSAWFSGGLAEYDIIGVALDATNSKIWFSQNGTWGNSSNPSTGSGGIDFSGDTDFTNYKPYFPAFSMHNCILTLNFGNGYLGTSEITTNGGNGFQDADGNGRFYYAVPTNFRCLSTKGLNQ